MPTLKETGPVPGHVYKIESPKFGQATVVCLRVPHLERAFHMQFAPLDRDGISSQTLYWDSVRDDQVLESFPSIRAYLQAIDEPAPAVERWTADQRGGKPIPAEESEGGSEDQGESPAARPAPPAVAVTVLPPVRPMPAGCKCAPVAWPALPFKIPPACKAYAENTLEEDKCVICEHLEICHHG